MKELEHIIHQRLMFVCDPGYTAAELQQILAVSLAPSEEEIKTILDILIGKGIAFKSDECRDGVVYKHIRYKGKNP